MGHKSNTTGEPQTLISPMLSVRGGKSAVEFYKSASAPASYSVSKARPATSSHDFRLVRPSSGSPTNPPSTRTSAPSPWAAAPCAW